MKIIFLGGIFDEGSKKEIIDSSKGVIQFAADNLQKSLIKGLCTFFSEIEIINLPFIGGFPFLYKKMYINLKESYFNNILVKNASFCNLIGYKIISRFFSSYASLGEFQKGNIIVYSINISFLLASVLRKRRYQGLKIILVIPDLPEYMNAKNGVFKSIALSIQNIILKNYIFPNIDGFVLLTKAMNEKLNIDENKIIVIEGIYSDTIIEKEINNIDSKFSILYTGTLAKRYGIIDLVSQFNSIDDENLELIICGSGDGQLEIEDFASKDNRIKYLGQLDRDEILNLQRRSSLLVNPRKPEDFTKYSFPSKTMEYFASGTPVLMYKLDGVPEEYYNYCFTIDSNIDNSIADKIIEIKKKDLTERMLIGKKAQEYIRKYKNENYQLLRLSEYLKKINNENK